VKAGALLLCVGMSAGSCRAKPVSSSADTSVSASAAVTTPNAGARDSASPRRTMARSLPLTWKPLPSGLSWSFAASSPAMAGSKFLFSFVIRNPTAKQLHAKLAGALSSGPFVEVTVTDRAGSEVWNNLHGQDLPFSGLGVPIPAHDSVEVTVLWDGLDNSGKRLPPGQYSAEGYLIPWVRNEPSVHSIRKRVQVP
jgi:hypothetical protein